MHETISPSPGLWKIIFLPKLVLVPESLGTAALEHVDVLKLFQTAFFFQGFAAGVEAR